MILQTEIVEQAIDGERRARFVKDVVAARDGTYPIGMHPSRGLVTPDNTLLYVANFGGGTVSRYSIDDGKLLDDVHTGMGPDALAMSREGHLLLVVDSTSADVAVVRTKTHSLFTLLPTGMGPSGIAVKAFTAR